MRQLQHRHQEVRRRVATLACSIRSSVTRSGDGGCRRRLLCNLPGTFARCASCQPAYRLLFAFVVVLVGPAAPSTTPAADRPLRRLRLPRLRRRCFSRTDCDGIDAGAATAAIGVALASSSKRLRRPAGCSSAPAASGLSGERADDTDRRRELAAPRPATRCRGPAGTADTPRATSTTACAAPSTRRLAA